MNGIAADLPYQFIPIVPISRYRQHAPMRIPRALATERPVALPLRKGRTMFTAEQYRAKAAQYDGFLAAAQSPAEIAEYRGLRQSYATANADKTMSTEVHAPRRKRRDRDAAYEEQENILRCLGAAVILNWNMIPTKLQRALFEAASTIQASGQAAPLRDTLARF